MAMLMKILDVIGYILIVCVVILVLYLIFERLYTHPLRMSLKEASSLIESGRINRIVDVRTQLEWERGHFKGAIHLPLTNITQMNARAVLDETDSILVYCNSGTRARQAALKLKELGYPDVHYIAETYHEL
jgi:rhodanese-related sulfurtransferase